MDVQTEIEIPPALAECVDATPDLLKRTLLALKGLKVGVRPGEVLAVYRVLSESDAERLPHREGNGHAISRALGWDVVGEARKYESEAGHAGCGAGADDLSADWFGGQPSSA